MSRSRARLVTRDIHLGDPLTNIHNLRSARRTERTCRIARPFGSTYPSLKLFNQDTYAYIASRRRMGS